MIRKQNALKLTMAGANFAFVSTHGDNRYFEVFKQARNKIRKYDTTDIVLACLERLHAPDAETLENMRRQPPWNLLLLMKWAIVHGDYSTYGKRTLTRGELNSLLNLMHVAGDSVPLPSKLDHPLVLLRAIGYQQFWHQETRDPIALLRQGMLFGHLDRSHTFRRWFEEETKVSIEDFVDLSFIVYTRFYSTNERFIDDGFFQPVAASFPYNCIVNFLNATSRTPHQVREYLVNLEDESHEPNEYYERTPLVRYPFLNLGGRCFFYTRKMLMHSLSTFVYDTLRRRDPQLFMDKFGRIFQDYVQTGVECTKATFYDENAMRRLVGRDEQVVDYLLVDPEVNVFIDAKGVEVGHLGMTSYRPGDVTNAVKSSVIKGISQGMEVVRSLQKLKSLPEVDFARSRNFLLLVTYKDLLLGTGQDFYESFGRERLESALQGAPQDTPIPLDQVYIVSIDEFDYLIACITNSRLSFAQVFDTAHARDSRPETKRLMLIQHLHDICGDIDVPAYLKQELECCFARISERLPECQQGNE